MTDQVTHPYKTAIRIIVNVCNKNQQNARLLHYQAHPDIDQTAYVVCLKSKCTDFLFKCLLDSHEITSYLLQSMTLGKLHIGSNVFSTDHSSTGSHFL